jgi:hypothetical protein
LALSREDQSCVLCAQDPTQEETFMVKAQTSLDEVVVTAGGRGGGRLRRRALPVALADRVGLTAALSARRPRRVSVSAHDAGVVRRDRQ